jgi:hypothetical protein
MARSSVARSASWWAIVLVAVGVSNAFLIQNKLPVAMKLGTATSIPYRRTRQPEIKMQMQSKDPRKEQGGFPASLCSDRRTMGRWAAAVAAAAVLPSAAKTANADEFQQLIMLEKPLPPPTNPYENMDIGSSYLGNRGPNLQV